MGLNIVNNGVTISLCETFEGERHQRIQLDSRLPYVLPYLCLEVGSDRIELKDLFRAMLTKSMPTGQRS